MNNFLTAIAVILVVILSALFAVPMMVDWDDYRSDFETRLTEILGTRVELDGSLNVRLLPTPYVRAENLRLGESGVEGRPILEVDELTLWVGIPPLLKGIVEASTLTLERPRLLLQFDKEGRPTFDAKRARESGKAPLDIQNGPGGDTSGVIISGLKLSPNLISLKNVRVNNGEVILQSPLIEGTDLRRVAFSGVAGVLSATTLSGPIYFNGRYGSEEDPSFVRLAVGKAVRGGTYPVRAKLTVPQVDHRYEFDGSLVDEKGRWQAKGALKATLGRFGNLGRRGVISADEIAPLVETRPDEELDEEEREAAELKKKQALARQARLTNAEQEIILTSQVVVKGAEAQFRKLLLRGGSLAQPQIVRGQLSINWRDKLSLKGRANGQVIDLNMIYGLQPNGKIDRITPAAALSNLNDLLLSQTAIFETIDFKAKANQINVGEGVVRDFQLMLKSDGERIEVKTFDAALPGTSRISVAGDFTQSEIAPGFQGDIYLRGLQFAEFIRWAAPTLKLDFNEEEEQSFGRGKFMLSGGVQMDEEAIALTGMQGDIAGSALRGEFQHKYARRGEADARRGQTLLKLRAGVLNVSDVVGQPVEVLNYEKGLTEFLNVAGLVAIPKEETPDKESSDKGNAGKSDVVTFDFAAQRLVFTDGEQRDVKLTWQADDQGGRIVALAGLSEHGLSIIFDKGGPGEPGAAALTEESEQPVRRFIVEANESSAVQDLLRWSGVFNSVDFDERTLRRFLPLRLAVHREEGEGVKNYRVDGVIGGNDAAFTVSVPDKSNADNDLPITLLGGLESPNGAALAAQLMPFGIAEVVPSQKAEAELDSEIDFGPARLTFSASGTAEEGFNGQFTLTNEQISLTYNGGVSVQTNKLVSKGLVSLESENTENIVQLFGLPPLADEEIQPFRGEVQLEQKLDGFAFNELKIAVGGLQIRGTGTFDVRDGERVYRLALATESVDVRTLLAPLQKNTGLSHRQGGSADEVWSDVPFKTGRELGQGDGNGVAETPGNAVRGEIVVQANELLISDQMSLTDANVQWRFSDDVIEIVRVEGKSLGGVFAASGTLRQDGDSYSLNGMAALVNGKLEEIGAAQEASLGTGVFSVNISLSGRGQSVRSLVGNLVGEGAVKIQDGQIRQLSPTLLYGVASAFLSAEGGDIRVVDDQLQRAIDQGGSLKVGSIDLGLELLDGTIRLNQPDLGIQPGTVGVEGQLKLEDLSWSGVWTIKPAEVNEASIPAIKRRMEGRLAAQQSFKSKLEAAEFERYLGLKQKEEELRRLEQARLEAEQRRLEEERRQKEEELRRLELERKRIEEEQRRLDEEINRSPLPPLFPE